jgi:hypothetical protein
MDHVEQSTTLTTLDSRCPDVRQPKPRRASTERRSIASRHVLARNGNSSTAREIDNMPLRGEYEPSPAQFVRDQVELYESSGGMQGTTPSAI